MKSQVAHKVAQRTLTFASGLARPGRVFDANSQTPPPALSGPVPDSIPMPAVGRNRVGQRQGQRRPRPPKTWTAWGRERKPAFPAFASPITVDVAEIVC